MVASTHDNPCHADNNHMPTVSNETASAAGTSHQSYSTSDGFSASFNEVSSVEIRPNNMVNINEDQSLDTRQSEMDYFPIIDETFWSYQDFHQDGGTYDMTDNGHGKQWQDQFTSDNASNARNIFSSMYDGNGQENYGGNTNFWYDIFLRASGAPDDQRPELPGF